MNDINDIKVFYLEGRISSENANELENMIFESLNSESDVPPVLDASKLDYISSAGLRVLMKLRKRFKEKLIIREVSLPVYEIFDTTGFTELFDVRKAVREISVDGCEVIGKGFFGTVYRLDEDTIVKVYNCDDAIERIRNEQKMAKAAFVKGLPTAISYDMVKVGDRYGSVFEMIRSRTFNDLIIENPEDADEYIRIYVDFIKKVHDTVMDAGTVTVAKEKYCVYLEAIRPYIEDRHYNFLSEELDKIPESLNLVHGDFQMKNVMMMDDEPMLIDMDTLSTGQPEFDIAALYVTYRLFGEDDPDNSMDFLGISNEMSEHIWNEIKERYYEGMDEEQRNHRLRRVRIIASIWFLYVVSLMEPGNPLRNIRIGRTGEHIDELMAGNNNEDRI